MAASSNRVSAAIQGFFSFSREMGTGGVCVATVHASGNIMPEAGQAFVAAGLSALAQVAAAIGIGTTHAAQRQFQPFQRRRTWSG